MNHELQKKKVAVAWLSVVSNTCLIIFKTIVGLWVGSISIVSEAIHSAVDLVAAIIALVTVRKSGKPADTDHPYGHFKLENLSGMFEGLLIFAAAIWIIVTAVSKLRHPEPLESLGWGVGVMLFSSVVNWIVSRMLFKVSRETRSIALEADACHLSTDVYTSVGVMMGLLVIELGRFFLPGRDLEWIDPVSAIAVAILIVHAAWELTSRAAHELADRSLPEAELAQIRQRLAKLSPDVKGFHALRSRTAGAARFVDFHLIVSGGMTVVDSHRLTEEVARDLEELFPGLDVVVHVEPCDGSCTPECCAGCLLPEAERDAVRKAALAQQGEKDHAPQG